MPEARIPFSDDHEIIHVSLCAIQICSLGTEESALKWIRSASPAGTTGNWTKSLDPDHQPLPCSRDKEKRHYVFIC